MKRNLLYFIYPAAANDEWRQNVTHLRQYFNVFNHKKIITVAQGPGTVPAAYVERELSGLNATLKTIANDERLGEVPAFLGALEQVASQDPDEITFYAHAKGVTPNRPEPVQRNLRRWRDLMYDHCLGNPARVERILRRHPCCGCFKKYGPALPEEDVDWHYSGAFFWFNHARLFSQDWKTIGASRYAVEGFLPRFFSRADAYCLVADDPAGYRLDLYTEEDWTKLESVRSHTPARRRFGETKRSTPNADMQLAQRAADWLEGPATSVEDGLLDIYMLLCHRDVPYGLFALKSFLRLVPLPCSVWVLDDGTLDKEDRMLIRHHIGGVHIQMMSKSSLKGLITGRRPCARFSRECVLAKRLLAPYAVGRARHLMLLDADALFFRRPQRIIDWVMTEEAASLFNKDSTRHDGLAIERDVLRRLELRAPDHFNAGLLCTRREFLDIDILERVLSALEHHGRPHSTWVWDQTVWACLVGRHAHEPLPASYSFVNDFNGPARHGPNAGRLTARHYSGRRRPDFFREGLRTLVTLADRSRLRAVATNGSAFRC